MNDAAETGSETTNPGSEVQAKRDIDKGLVLRLVIGVAILGFFTLFALQNISQVEVDLVTATFNVSLIIVMLLSAAVGVIVWELAKFIDRRRSK